jgi:hypothetical protein
MRVLLKIPAAPYGHFGSITALMNELPFPVAFHAKRVLDMIERNRKYSFEKLMGGGSQHIL